MDASGYGKHITLAEDHLDEAVDILNMGVHEEISEYTALLCADTQLMLAIHDLEDSRRRLKARMVNMRGVDNV